GRPTVVMRRPAPDRRPFAVGPLGEETPGPVEIVAVRPGGNQVELHTILGKPLGELAIFAAEILGCEFAAAAPALVADTPVADAQRLALAVGRALIGQRGRAGRRVAVLDPLLIFFRRPRSDVGGEIGLDIAEPAEPD